MRRLLSLFTLLTAVTALLLTGAGPASAHSALKSTDPRDGTVLKTAPQQVTLIFTESVGLADDSLRVLDPGNTRINKTNAAHVKGRSDTVRVRLGDKLPDGTYTVAWRVVSADSHPISGAFTFSIGAPSETTAVVGPTEDPVTSRLYNSVRYFAYGGLALLIGVVTFVLACWPAGLTVRPLRRLLKAGWWTLLVSTAVLLPLRGPYETGDGPSGVFDISLLGRTLESRPGLALVARLVLLAGTAVYLVRLLAGSRERAAEGVSEEVAGGVSEDVSQGSRGDGTPKRSTVVWGAVLALALTVTWAVAEHASAGIQVPAAMTSSVLHLVAMGVWLGGLTALLTVLHRRPAGSAELPAAAVVRFSRLAFASVVVLVLTGVYQSWRGLGSVEAITTTEYGRLLNLKVGIVIAMLGAAAISRRWTEQLSAPARAEGSAPAPVSEPAEEKVSIRVGADASGEGDGTSAGDGSAGVSAGDGAGGGSGAVQRKPGSGPGPNPGPYARLRRCVLAEVVIGVLVLVVTTALTGTQPGRAELETAAATAESGVGQRAATTTLIPFDVGTPNGHGKVQVILEPGRVGENTVECVIIGPDGGIATVPEIRLTFTLAKQKIGPLDARLENRGGYWGTESVNLPIAGTWTMNATIRTTDIDQVTVSKTVEISPALGGS